MSAADLFKDIHDVDFRLRGTMIVVGRSVFNVDQISSSGYGGSAEDAILCMTDMDGDPVKVPLKSLPLHAMTYCPSGYDEGIWFCRGPARHRYQGITSMSLWGVYDNGRILSEGVGGLRKLLMKLSVQPKTRRPGKRAQGILTRDVMIRPDSSVLVQGIIRAEHIGDSHVKLLEEPDPMTMRYLDNAKLSVV